MGAIVKQDARRLLLSLQAVYAARTIEQFAEAVMRELLALVPSDMAAYNEVDLADRNRALNRTLPDVRTPALEAAFERNVAQHPGLQRYLRLADPGPWRVLELVSRSQWTQTGMYDEMWRPLATDDQIVVFLAPPPRIAAASISRGRREYTERERDLVAILRPHLRMARESVMALMRAQERSDQLIAQLGGEMVILDPCSVVRTATENAFELIGDYFSEPSPPPSGLPESLMRWVGNQRGLLAGEDPLALQRPLTVAGKAGTLSVRSIFDGDETILVFEHRATSMASCVAGLPLTDRERQIVVFLADGNTNVAIAAALHISSLTVKKHLEHIYEKLGVAGRAAAVARALAGPIRSFPFAIALSALFEW